MKIYYRMAAMPGMPPMNYKTIANTDSDKYSASLDLTMAGQWNVDIKIKTPDGQKGKVSFDLDITA